VLYPGSESRFFTTAGTRLDLATAALPGNVDGVGAIALRPEEGGDATICAVFRQLLGGSAQGRVVYVP
jgi:hypothetical protein